MKKILFTSVIGIGMLLSISGCSNVNIYTNTLIKEGKTQSEVYQYDKDMTNVTKELSENKDFKQFKLNNKKDIKWYADLTYKLWNKEIEKEDFVVKAIEHKKGYRKMYELIADKIIKNRYKN